MEDQLTGRAARALAGALITGVSVFACAGAVSDDSRARRPSAPSLLLTSADPEKSGPDSPHRVEIAVRSGEGSSRPIAGEFIHALEFRDGVAALDLARQLQLIRADGSRSVLARNLDGLPSLAADGGLVFAARHGRWVDIQWLTPTGRAERLASFPGSATLLAPLSGRRVLFVGATPQSAAGVWLAESGRARCVANCNLIVGQPWEDAYLPLPGSTSGFKLVGDTVHWISPDGQHLSAPLGTGASTGALQ